MTNTEPGEIFILSSVGNIIPSHTAANGGEAATIEYAVKALGVQDIIVCGHSDCSVMRALMHPERLVSMPAVVQWLNNAKAASWLVQENYSDLSDEQKMNVVIQENVLVQLENIKTLPAVASKLINGELKLHGWVYKYETGEIFAYNAEQGQFIKLTEDR